MTQYVEKGSLKIAEELFHFIEKEALPGAEVDSEQFWQGFEKLIADLTPKNKQLLQKEKTYKHRLMNGIQHKKRLMRNSINSF